jgi:uncharacterized protein with PQ loop repeat
MTGVPPGGESALDAFLSAVGWIPSVVFPLASLIQLVSLVRRGKSNGVSLVTWSMFALANVCLYLTIGEWTKPQVIASTLGAAAVQVAIVVVAARLRHAESPDKNSGHRSSDSGA